MGELANCVNIGPKLEAQLYETGVKTFDELKEIGAKEAWLRIKAIDSSACIMRLYGLHGAILGIRWHNLDDRIKKELKQFYLEHK